MNKLTKDDIINACTHLQTALLEELEANEMEVESKTKKIAAHYNVMKAKDKLRDISNY